MIAARAVQGLAGGMFFTTIKALIQLMFAGRERGRAFAILGATIGFSTALGPLAGGLIIQAFGAETGWRLVFGVNIPIGIVAVVAAAVFLPGGAEIRIAQPIGSDCVAHDGPGALLTPLIEGQQEGWPSWTYVSMVGGAVLIALFALWERRLEKARPQSAGTTAVVRSSFVHRRGITRLVYFAAFTSIFFTIALLWQAGLGHTALQSGLVAMPFAVGSIIGASQSDISPRDSAAGCWSAALVW